MDYQRLMKEGFDGMIKRAEEGLAKLTKEDPDFAVKRDSMRLSSSVIMRRKNISADMRNWLVRRRKKKVTL